MPIWGEVELLCRAVAEEGRIEAERIRSQAGADAATMIAAARDAADRAYREELLIRKRDAFAEAKRIVDSAELDAKKRLVAFREQIVREVLLLLERRLQTCRTEPGYVNFLRSALKEGIEHLPGGSFVVHLNGAEAALLEREIAQLSEEGSLHIELRTDPSCEGGVRVATRDNRLLFDNSFAARLKRGEHEIRHEIWRTIFGSPSAAD